MKNQLRAALQINLAPLDEPHVRILLPHHLRQLGEQVDEVILTLDVHHSVGSRYRAENYESKLASIRDYLGAIQQSNSKVKLLEVDYSPETVSRVSQMFLRQPTMPKKAENGSPLYAYLYGIFCTSTDYVFHMDSDIFYGGGSQTWISEAIELMETDDSIFVCSPLPGPPREDRKIANGRHVQPDPTKFFYHFPSVSTRMFLIDKRRFATVDSRLTMVPARPLRAIQAFIFDNPPYLALEECLTLMMNRNGLKRVDFLGQGQGLWSVHPLRRSQGFYSALPDLVNQVETGQVPLEQRGHYNIVNKFFDWTDVERRQTFAAKVIKWLRYARAGLASRLRRRLNT